MKFKVTVVAAAATIGMIGINACGGSAGAGRGGEGRTTLHLVAYSVPQAANKRIEKDFAKTPEGKGVTWKESYGASGDQSRAVAGGLPADYVHFSVEGDVTRLVDDGLVAKDWNKGPTKGIISSSVVVFVVRKGNPKHINSWDDLVKPGVKIVTPNPGSSGSAKWNILAAWGHVLAEGGNDTQAKAFLTRLFKNVAALPGSGRDATTAFTGGTGDVLLSYENEAILARQQGQDFDYVVPEDTLKIENPGAVLKDANPKAKTWLHYLTTKPAQTEFAKTGFRPVIDGVKTRVEGANDPDHPFPVPKKLLTIKHDFGGWPSADKKFFAEEDGIVPAIMRATGKD